MGELRRRSRGERGALGVVTAGLLLAAIAPVWSSRYLPLLDEPNHLGAIAIWRGLWDHVPSFEAFYELRLAPVSYFAHYGLAFALSSVLGVEAAHKAVLSLTVIGVPLAGFAWCARTGRSPWLALLTVPLAYSTGWAQGFHPWNLGLVLLLLGLAAFDALAEAPTRGRLTLSMAAAVACYFAHPLALGLLCAGVATLVLVHRAGPKRALVTVCALAPSLALLGWQARATRVSVGATGRVLGAKFPVVDPAVWWQRVLDLPEHAVNPVAGWWDSASFVAAVAVAAVVTAVAARGGGAGRAPGARLLAHRALVLASAFFALYLILPEHFQAPVYIWTARGRLAPIVGFFLLVSAPAGPDGRGRFLAAGTALALAALPVALAVRYHAFGRELAAMEHVLEACPADENVLTLRVGDQRHAGYDVPVFRQLPSWVQVVRGGYSPLSFPRPIPFPFAVKRRLPAPHWRAHERYGRALDPRAYGCVLTHRMEAPLPEDAWRRVAEEGEFRLYRKREGAESPLPPAP